MFNLCFAYGSNLWRDQMKNRCPGHRVVGQGVLKGYRWYITERGYANLIPSENDEVYGIVYALTPEDEAVMDKYEGVDVGHFIKRYVNVLVNGEDCRALVYLDSNPDIQEGSPKPEYIERMNKGLQDAQLPEDYVNRYIRPVIPETIPE